MQDEKGEKKTYLSGQNMVLGAATQGRLSSVAKRLVSFGVSPLLALLPSSSSGSLNSAFLPADRSCVKPFTRLYCTGGN